MSEWRKSSRSQSTDSCVEVRRDRAAVRDSKNPAGPVLSCANLPLLIAQLKDRPA
ncbi:MAG TPA: DUF397 domain-containing protein [Pseudonocardiaceae bacterium]|nr:DUF397 domain-containing protein [Pseudonocardiaceae bacterium]